MDSFTKLWWGLLVQILSVNIGVMTNILEKRTFLYLPNPLTWTDADNVCTTSGGRLPKISDSSTLPDIAEQLSVLKDTDAVWIGLKLESGVWRWKDGSYVEWYTLSLQNNSDGYKCVSVSWKQDFVFEKTDCNKTLPFLCEYLIGNCSFKRYNHSSIVAYNMFGTSTSLENCRELCVQSTEKLCLSFEYNTVGRYCQLSDTNRWIHSENYAYYDASWDYFHRTCITARIWSDDDDIFKMVMNQSSALPVTTPPTIITTEIIDIKLIEPRRYILYTDAVTWEDAENICQANGGSLAIIYDKSTLPEAGYSSDQQMWIGLYRANTRWRWVDDTVPVTWTNWRYIPSIHDLNNCGTVALKDEFQWIPDVCSKTRGFICQYAEDSCKYLIKRNASLLANNNVVLVNVSFEECQDTCDSITDLNCRSFEYNEVRRQCHISKDNKWTSPNFYHEDVSGWNYYHRKCNFGDEQLTTIQTTLEHTDWQSTSFGTTEEESTTASVAPTTPTPIQTFKELQDELESFGEKIKNKRILESKTSVMDTRPSATSVGVIAIVILSCILGGVVLIDLGTICSHCKYMNNCYGRKQKQKKLSSRKQFDNHIEVYEYENDKISNGKCTNDTKNNHLVRVINNNTKDACVGTDINDFPIYCCNCSKEETTEKKNLDLPSNSYVSIIDVRIDLKSDENEELVTYM